MTQSRPLTSPDADDMTAIGPVAPAGASAPAGTAAPVDPNAAVTKAFSMSVLVSAVRCLLTYILFPWVLPLLGVAKGVGPVVGLTVGVVAIGFNVASIRRFMRSGHRYRYWISGLNVMVIGLLVVLIVRDLSELLG
ncbi:MAG: hypothetical protein MUE36_03905 [Acidimicrobiales bacterium]|nr:hypothetical protein [Acidimicrobiales bacterium]